MCSDLCLLKPRGYQCACPTGIVLKEDGKNCDYGEATYSMFQALRRRGGGGKDFLSLIVHIKKSSYTSVEKKRLALLITKSRNKSNKL